MHYANNLVREQLQTHTERRKTYYELNMNPHTFRPNDWVWYFYPRRRTGRSTKWERLYTGPYLVIDQVGPVNYIIQKSQKADPMVVHVDNLKLCESKTPCSLLLPTVSDDNGPDETPNLSGQTIDTNTQGDVQPSNGVVDQRGTYFSPSTRPWATKRLRKPPQWASDYVM